jgi:predicted RNase H-like nuclease (RuvC/YqgF family)
MSELVQITIEEAQSLFNKSRATIYNWMNSGRLKFDGEGDSRIILLTPDEIEKLKVNSKPQSNNLNQQESKLDENSILIRILDQNEKLIEKNDQLIEKLEGYAKESGQVKLLTDNNKFYQDEYFKFKYKNEELEKELESKKNKILELESKLNELESLRSINKNQADKIKELEVKPAVKTDLHKKPGFFDRFKK